MKKLLFVLVILSYIYFFKDDYKKNKVFKIVKDNEDVIVTDFNNCLKMLSNEDEC